MFSCMLRFDQNKFGYRIANAGLSALARFSTAPLRNNHKKYLSEEVRKEKNPGVDYLAVLDFTEDGNLYYITL